MKVTDRDRELCAESDLRYGSLIVDYEIDVFNFNFNFSLSLSLDMFTLSHIFQCIGPFLEILSHTGWLNLYAMAHQNEISMSHSVVLKLKKVGWICVLRQ